MAIYYNSQDPDLWSQASKWFRIAAEQAFAPSCRQLALILGFNPDKSLRNCAEGIALTLKAAQLGDRTAIHNRGIDLLNGSFIARDYVESAHWFRLGAARGYADSMYRLALLHRDGNGAHKDRKLYLYWINKARALKCKDAMNHSVECCILL